MKYLIIIVLLSACAGAAKAIQDTIAHHYDSSVFYGAGAYWSPESWKLKYKDYDAGDLRPRFPGSTTILVAFTDAWHLFDNLRTLLLTAAAAMAGVAMARHANDRQPWRAWLLYAAACMAPFFVLFKLLYTYILV